MQTKKRAKPVKFGGKEKAKKNVPSKLPEKAESHVAEALRDKEEVEVSEITETVAVPEQDSSSEADLIEDSDKKEDGQTDDEPSLMLKSQPGIGGNSEFFNVPPGKYEKHKNMIPYFLFVTFVTFLLGLAFFTGIYYAVNNKPNKNQILPKPASTLTKTPEKEKPTEKPLDLSLYTIKILNGTEVSGVAAKLKTQLEDAGFKVGSVGNADKDNYTKTEIAAGKKVAKSYLDKLKEILKKTYVLGSTSTLASGDADVVITIGSSSAK